MANDSPQQPSPEQIIAQGLVGGSDKPAAPPTQAAQTDAALHQDAYGQPGAPNADKPGAPATVADKQNGGPAAPPGDAAPTTVANNDAPAPAAPTPGKDAPAAGPAPAKDTTTGPATPQGDAAAHPAPAADAADKTRTPDVVAANAHGLAVEQQVNAILDGDVPKYNKAHDLDDAKKSYDQAIALANTLTPQDLTQAQHDLDQVRKDKLAATDPATKQDLAQKEVALYTITRLKDAATGNMALWYYRQGKTEQGNEKLLEACGVDPTTATSLQKMGPDDIKKFGAILDAGQTISPVLGDTNFFRQLNKIKATGVQVPEVFGKINQAVLEHNAQVAAQGGADKGAGAGSDQSAGASPAGSYDQKKVDADIQAFLNLNDQLKDHTGPLTADQRKILEDGVAAYDAKNKHYGDDMDNCQKVLDAAMPRDKQKAYGDAEAAANAELTKLAVQTDVTGPDGKVTKQAKLPDDVMAKVTAVVGAKNPADFKTAADDLAKTQPALAKALTDAAAALPPGEAGLKAASLFDAETKLQNKFVNSSEQQALAHYAYANILSNTGDPKDASHAKEVFVNGLQNIPTPVAENIVNTTEAQALIKKLNITDLSPNSQATGTDQHAAAPGSAADQKANPLASVDVAQLQAMKADALKKGAAGLDDAKAIYAEELRRAEDPDKRKQFTDSLTANLAQLESGKGPDGKPLDADTRTKLNGENVDLISALAVPAQLHSEMALYLGDGRLGLPDDPTVYRDKIPGGLNQLKSMDEEQKKAIAAADSIDPTLLKRADTQIEAQRKDNVGDQTLLDAMQVQMRGGKDANGNETLGLLNMRVTMRDQLAALYLMQGKQFKPDGSVMSSIAPGSHQTDSLFKPQDALDLLKQAQTAYQQINGQGKMDNTTNQLLAMGQTMQPDVFKNAASDLKNQGASMVSDMAALGGSLGGKAVLTWAGVAVGELITKGELPPALVTAIGQAGAIGGGIATRRVVHGLLTGESEPWATTVVHGTAAALAPTIIKGTANFLAENGTASRLLNIRSAALTGEQVLQRSAASIGEDATFGDVANMFRARGLTTEAGQLDALADQKVSQASTAELETVSKGLNLDGARAREAMIKLFPSIDGAPANTKILDALDQRGITRVGQLRAAMAKNAADLNGLVQEANATKISNSTPIEKWIADQQTAASEASQSANGEKFAVTKETVDNNAAFFKQNGIKTVGDLRRFAADKDFFNADAVFPGMKGVSGDTPLRDIANGPGFGTDPKVVPPGRVPLKEIVDDTAIDSPVPKLGPLGRLGSAGDRLAGKGADVLWRDRVFYAKGPLVELPNLRGVTSDLGAGTGAADGAAGQGSSRIGGALNRIKPEFHLPTMPNAQQLDGMFSTSKQFAIADTQTKFWTAAIATGAGMMEYNSATNLYDNWWSGKQYQDSHGQWQKYSFMDALGSAATTSMGEALVGGFLLKGKIVPSALEAESTQAVPSTGWLSRKVPALNSQAILDANQAIRGSGSQISSFTKLGIFMPNTYQGVLDGLNASDNKKTYDSTQAPLRDQAPDDIGTTADQIQGGAQPTGDAPAQAAPQQAAAPAGGDANAAATHPDSPSAKPPDPNADVSTGAAGAPPAQAASPAAPAAAPKKAGGSDVGANLGAPGS